MFFFFGLLSGFIFTLNLIYFLVFFYFWYLVSSRVSLSPHFLLSLPPPVLCPVIFFSSLMSLFLPSLISSLIPYLFTTLYYFPT